MKRVFKSPEAKETEAIFHSVFFKKTKTQRKNLTFEMFYHTEHVQIASKQHDKVILGFTEETAAKAVFKHLPVCLPPPPQPETVRSYITVGAMCTFYCYIITFIFIFLIYSFVSNS